jgi:RNA polymerase sigma-70 factor (ECF subfamily)
MHNHFRTQLVALLPQLRRFALALTGVPDAADDLVQTACIRALAASEQWQPDTRMDSWMYKILQNLFIDQRRALVTAGGGSAMEDLDMLPDEVDFEAGVHAQLSLAQVLSAMQKLPDAQRSLLALVSVEGLSYKEAAEVLGLPMGTVMSRLARARIALKSYLQESQP